MPNDETVETGLVAAAVTMDEEKRATIQDFKPDDPVPHPDDPRRFDPPAVIEAPAGKMPEGWTLHTVAALVTDVAQNMYETPYLLKKHKLTAEQYDFLKENAFFKRALEAEIITWQGTNSIQKRLALEGAIALENALPTVAARLSKSTEPLGEIVSLVKVLAEIAGIIGAKAVAPGATGEKFKIVINLGADTLERPATGSVEVQSLPREESISGTLQSLTQTPHSGPALRALPEGN